ncbi:MAG: hypothetical protein WKG01_38625, partial [Kofleriaceae bacterium]
MQSTDTGRPSTMPPKGLCIVTRCTSTDELVARLHPFCSERSIFVTTNRVWEVGTEARFAITLADRTVVLHGRCQVLGAWTHSDNEFGKPGVKLGIIELRGNSKHVFQQILAARARMGTSEIVIAAPRRMRPAKPSQHAIAAPPGPVFDGPTERNPQPIVLQAAGAIVGQPIPLDPTSRSSSPPMPPRTAIARKVPVVPVSRPPFGTPKNGIPLGTPNARPRGTTGALGSNGIPTNVTGLGRCPGAEESAAINARLASEAAKAQAGTKRTNDPTRPMRPGDLPILPRAAELPPPRPSEPTLVRRTVDGQRHDVLPEN